MKRIILGVMVLMAVMAIPAFAVYDMYLSIDGVAGAPADTAHKDWMPITEIQDQTIKPAGTVGLVINKLADGNSAALYRNCLSGRPSPNAMLDIMKDGVLFCKMTMRSVLVAQIKPKLTKADGVMQEELTLSFSDINWDFYATGADGKAVDNKASWSNETKK